MIVVQNVKHRCRHDIIYDILLNVSKRKAKISHIAQGANLPLDRARTFVNNLVKHGLLIFNPIERTYLITPKGYEWLAIYRKLKEIYDQ